MEWQSIWALSSCSVWLAKSDFLLIPCLDLWSFPKSLWAISDAFTSELWLWASTSVSLFYSPVVHTQALTDTRGTVHEYSEWVSRELSNLALEPLGRLGLVSCLPLSPSLTHPHQTQETTWRKVTKQVQKDVWIVHMQSTAGIFSYQICKILWLSFYSLKMRIWNSKMLNDLYKVSEFMVEPEFKPWWQVEFSIQNFDSQCVAFITSTMWISTPGFGRSHSQYISTAQPATDIKHLKKAPSRRAFILVRNSRLQFKIVEKSRQELEAASHMHRQKQRENVCKQASKCLVPSFLFI